MAMWLIEELNAKGNFLNVSYLYFLAEKDHILRRDSGRNLGLLLKASKQLCAVQPRDHVYGMLGLLSGPDQRRSPLLDPQYTKPVADVFRDATRYVIEQDSSLHTFSDISQRSNLESANQKLPSWAIDWSRHSVHLEDPTAFSRRFNASRHGDLRLQLSVSEDSDLINLGGFKLDEIVDVAPALPMTRPSELLSQWAARLQIYIQDGAKDVRVSNL